MKTLLTLSIIMVSCGVFAQEPVPVPEQQLENQAETTEMENEDDSYWQQLESLRRHPLDLNAATPADLEALPLLNALQIANFLRYRSLLGSLVSVHELQAIPGWDLHTIRQLLPLVIIGTGENPAAPFGRRLVAGSHALVVRASQVLERSKGFQAPLTPDKDHYQGSGVRVFSRYRYNYNNLLQYGITADKDAGESLFAGSSKAGFDFYSYHLFARKLGKVKALALGDFTVNMGQGLIHWQSLAFKKSAAVLQVKRQGPVLRPYSAAGEYYFHRGAGITLQHKNWETTLFASIRKPDANLVNDSITSVLTSGYHRTLAELNDRQNLERITAGGAVRYSRPGWHMGFNTVQYGFSKPFKRSGEPYDIFSVEGKHWGNHSLDYSFTHRNLHIYGEAAIDQQMHKALLNGLLMSLDKKVDIALVYRQMDRDYQSLQGNAFTENYLPGNEQGLYAGLSVRPSPYWQLDAYADCFRFPWLKYRVNAPGNGAEYLLQLLYKPNKGVELSSRYRYEHKPANSTADEGPLKPVLKTIRQNWRTQVMFQATPDIMLKSRVELVWYQAGVAANAEKGFAAFTEVFYAPKNSFSANMRIQFFETDGYNARIYAYEQDVQYYFSIPQFSGKGLRYYVNCKQNVSSILFRKRARKIDCVVWFRLAQFLFPDKTLIGSGFDEMLTRKKTEFRLQLMLITR